MEQLFKCYVCEQYFDQYALELHFVTTHNLDEEDEEEEENSSTAESDLMKHVKNVQGKNAHEKSNGVILEPRADAVRQNPIAVVLILIRCISMQAR